LVSLWVALALAVCVGVLGRGYWTPDEPREADISWRMSWQTDKSVPLLAGEAFCEKPPLTYWLAGTAIGVLGTDAWAARLPNLLYALITALAVGSLGRRSAGRIAGWAAAAAITTFLLSYQVAIWLATDAPLLASVAAALLGLYLGFYAETTPERVRGYTCMHAALAVGFLSKSAAGWMVPATAFVTLVIWEKRWRELLRWELYAGLGLQAVLILAWVGSVYSGPDGLAHLKVFFWNNLAGRFAHVDAPEALQYAAAHRNSPGKYFIELPLYLWPWTLLVIAAIRRAWLQRHASALDLRPVRFSVAAAVPTLAVLSVAATARNIYLAPALPGAALLLGWWVRQLDEGDRWDIRAIRATGFLLLLALIVVAAAAVIIGWDSWDTLHARGAFVGITALGLAGAAGLLLAAARAVRRGLLPRALFGLLLAYCALLVGPASQIYGRIDTWQNLAAIGRAIGQDSMDRPMILFTADETTRAIIDMYARTSVTFLPGPLSPAATERLRQELARAPRSVVVTQLPGRNGSRTLRELAARLSLKHSVPPPATEADQRPPWAVDAGLRMVRRYALPNGRRYALLEKGDATSSR
jgi:4-amino-4-deoxy-L-arabinose transferase-like glycosyltransferase